MYAIYLTIFFRVASLVGKWGNRQIGDANDLILKDVDKLDR